MKPKKAQEKEHPNDVPSLTVMKKAIIGVVAVATIGLLPVIWRKARTVREHCERMAAKCRRMMDAEAGGTRVRRERVTGQPSGSADQFGVGAAQARAREHSERRRRRPVVAASAG